MAKVNISVDETGVDTLGKLFRVAVFISPAEEKETLKLQALEIEVASKKGTRSWASRSLAPRERVAYANAIAAETSFTGRLYLVDFANRLDYRAMTIEAIARVAKTYGIIDAVAIVEIDGDLSKKVVQEYANGLRDASLFVDKVRGVRDQNEPLIRVCDAVCGWSRDIKDVELGRAFKNAERKGIITRL